MSAAPFRHLDAPPPARDALAALPGPVAAWFRDRFGEPTPVQRLAWSALGLGDHVLVSAPTGTGKTLAALAPLLGPLLEPFDPPTWSTSPLRLLYVAPLKALVNDAGRGLEGHLDELPGYWSPEARRPRLSSRTGDTPAAERRRLRDDPPDVLLTTPESLAVLLSQPSAAGLFANLTHVVIDEVHALIGNKRGADLAVSLERLPEGVRRVGLSATATPLDTAARWLVGVGRGCSVVRAAEASAPEVLLEPLPEGGRFLAALIDRLAAELPRHRAVLVFTNTRGLAERLAWGLRHKLPEWDALIAVHHSAVAAGRREEVEAKFKRGELRAVVSSTSLELGIDIGTVDLAVLVHPPGDVVRLLQRVGRAGHEPGGVRRGLLLTATAAELLEAAVTCASGRAGQCEPLDLADAPLDVLCQQLVGLCCARSVDPDEMFALVTRSAPFAGLKRADFDAVLSYLRGLDGRGEAWLPARLREDGDCFRVKDARTARLLRRNLGTILSERTVAVRLRGASGPPLPLKTGGEGLGVRGRAGHTLPPLTPDPSPPSTGERGARTIGEVDEAFAERLQPGDRFLLDGRCLEYRGREDGAAVVEEVPGRPRVPRWNGGGWPLSAQLARRLFLLRQHAAEALRDGPAALQRLLGEDYGLTAPAAEALAAYFQEQESVSEVPDATTLLAELVRHDGGAEYYLHTPLNRPANDALARVAARRLEGLVSTEVADLGLMLRLRAELPDPASAVRQLFAAERFTADLDAALRGSEALRTRFARVATTGLMLLRHPEGQPRKVGGSAWAERRLFEQVRAHDDGFVLLRQALREVGEELCDATAARAYCEELPRFTIRCRALPRPSPFVRAWTQSEAGEPDHARTAAEALERLHAQLTGGGGAGTG